MILVGKKLPCLKIICYFNLGERYYEKGRIFLFVLFLLVSCGDVSNQKSYITSPINDDFSSIVEPRERWKAYNLSSYTIDQNWACECYSPTGCSSYIVNKVLTDVIYDIPKEAYYGRSEKEIFDYTKRMAITVDEAFDLIDKYKTSADIIEVEYDSRFGFPSKLYIDINAQTADEEISRRFSNIQQILN